MKAPEQQNALFRSSCVELVTPGTAREDAGERLLLAKGYDEHRKKKKGTEDSPDVSAHRLRPFIMCVFYYPDSWHPLRSVRI